MSDVYWLAIDKSDNNSSYKELKDRSVIAQGWSSINLQSLFPPETQANKNTFQKDVLSLGNQAYGNYDWWVKTDKNHVPRIMYTLASLKRGDLVVGIEGRKVQGICEVKNAGWESYHYDTSGDFEYRNTFGGQVQWIDWCPHRIGKPPTPSHQSVKGIARLVKEKDYILDIWGNIDFKNLTYSREKVEETLRAYDNLMDGKIGYRDNKVFFKHSNVQTGYFVEFGNVYCKNWLLESCDDSQPPIKFSSIEDLVRSGWVLD